MCWSLRAFLRYLTSTIGAESARSGRRGAPPAELSAAISAIKGAMCLIMLNRFGHMHSHKRFRRMKHRLMLSALATLVAVALPGLAEARGGRDGGGFRHGSWHPGGAAASRFGGTGAWLGASSAGTNHRFDAGGHEGSGWYHRGWGGTTAPGWGYGRGPNSRIGSWKRLRSTIGNASLSAPAPDAPISVFLLGRRSGGP
jgi:hypothetical protein